MLCKCETFGFLPAIARKMETLQMFPYGSKFDSTNKLVKIEKLVKN